MPCYHPLNAYRTSTFVDGKRKIVFAKDKELSDEYLASIGAERLSIPCGNCLGCRLEYSRQWAVRCYFEAKQHKHNYFVTLTYDDEHVPLNDHLNVDKETGEVLSSEVVMTLNPVDLQKFIKRLRTNARRDGIKEDGIRFFGCGEYGEQKGRPHYHLILFDCPLPDLEVKYIQDGNAYYTSAFLERTWNKGIVIVADFSFQTAAYVARYMLKKHKGHDANYYEEHGLVPEFTRCSRRPGIGYDYFRQNKLSIYTSDEVYLPQKDGEPLAVSPPAYYDRLMEVDEPALLEYNKANRKERAIVSQKQRMSRTDLKQDEYLANAEVNKARSIRKLKRSV